MRESPAKALRVVTLIAWAGVILVTGWLTWCLIIPPGSLTVEAEILEKRVEQHRGYRGHKYTSTHGVVRYLDQEARPNTGRVELFGNEDVGKKVLVRYQPDRPNYCQRADLRGLWGIAIIAVIVLAVHLVVRWLAARSRRRKAAPKNPFAQTPP